MPRPLRTNYGTVDELIPQLHVGDLIELLDKDVGSQLEEFRLSPDDPETEGISGGGNEWCMYIGKEGDEHFVISKETVEISRLPRYEWLPTKSKKKLDIVRKSLTTVASDSKCRINNDLDRYFKPENDESIVTEVNKKLNNDRIVAFDAYLPFLMRCRYGIDSDVVDKFIDDHQRSGLLFRYANSLGRKFDAGPFSTEDLKRNHQIPASKEWVSYNELLHELCIGDMLEFKCTGPYTHWGIYIGRTFGVPMVIHKTQIVGNGPPTSGSCNTASVTSHTKSEVRQEPLAAVAGDRLCRINNIKKDPLPPLEIVRNAFRFLQQEERKSYNLVAKNCEHFATLCRYGQDSSLQIHQIAQVLLLILFLGSLALYNSHPLLVVILAQPFIFHAMYMIHLGRYPFLLKIILWPLIKLLEYTVYGVFKFCPCFKRTRNENDVSLI